MRPRSQYPGLRTKNGCFNCRHDRKKCNEQKPQCGRCRQLKRKCPWPVVASLLLRDRRMHSKAPIETSRLHSLAQVSRDTIPNTCGSYRTACQPLTSRSYSPALSAGCYPTLDSNSEICLFNYFVKKFYPILLLPKAHSGFSTVISYVARLTLNDMSMKNISLGCAALHLHTTTGQSAYQTLALSYYGKALSGVRSQLQKGAITSGECGDALIFTLSFLCIFATWSQNRSGDIPYHVAGARQFFKLRFFNNDLERSEEQKVVDRVILESVLYQTFMLSVDNAFSPNVNSDPEFWELAINELHRVAFPEGSAFENSPVLGVPLALHSLIFRILQICRSTEAVKKDSEIRYLAMQLDLWNKRVECNEDQFSVDPHAKTPYHISNALYVLAASILLETCISKATDLAPGIILNAATQDSVNKAIHVLQRIRKDDPCSRNYLGIWTLRVIGLATTNERDRKIILDELERRWACWGSGDIKRYIHSLKE